MYSGFKQTETPFGVLNIHSPLKCLSKKNISIKVNSDILFDDVVIKMDTEKLTVERVGIDYTGKTRSLNMASYGWFNTVLTGCDVGVGKYIACDEESTFDKYVFYYEDKVGV